MRPGLKVGYVLKRYPRYSETFVVNEILAHEAAGVELEIFSLLPCSDAHFQDAISRVKAPVHYLPSEGSKVSGFWRRLVAASEGLLNFWEKLGRSKNEPVRELAQAVALAQQVQERRIGHLHAHFATASTTVARLASRFASVPYTFTAHAKDIFHESAVTEDLREKMRDASGVVTVSDYNLKYLQERCGEAAGKVRRIYNGLDLNRFPYREPQKRESLVLGVGRLVEKKGFADLVEACAVLGRRRADFRCLIVGAGEEEAALRRQIASRGVGDRVELAGPLPQSALLELMARAAVLAAPCVVGQDGNRDGLPTVLLEAMALGTPCVSTEVTGIPEVIRDGTTGLMVGQHDPDGLSAALERLLDDGGLRQRLAKQARELVESEFDVIQAGRRLRELFDEAAGGREGQG